MKVQLNTPGGSLSNPGQLSYQVFLSFNLDGNFKTMFAFSFCSEPLEKKTFDLDNPEEKHQFFALLKSKKVEFQMSEVLLNCLMDKPCN